MTGVLNALRVKLGWAAQWRRALRAWDPASGRSRLPGPLKLHLQTVNRCNAACLACPYPAAAGRSAPHRMPDDLFREVVGGYGRLGTVESCVLMLQNEPFLDPALPARVRTARELLGPRAVLHTVTNGTILPPDGGAALRRAGLDQLHVSLDAATPETFARLRPGHDFHQVRAHAEAFVRAFPRGRVTVKFLQQRENQGEEKAFLRYWRARGARVKLGKLTNRAGAVANFAALRPDRPDPVRRLLAPLLRRLIPCCPLPFTAACVLSDGRAILCCHDWGPAQVLGDLAREAPVEVWNGPAVRRHRTLLWSHRAAESSVCRGCSLAWEFFGE